MGLASSDKVPGSLFSQPWWLDAVAPGEWDEVVVNRDGELIARLPYVVKRRYGFILLMTPPLTPFLGPWVKASSGKYVTQLSDEKKLLTELVERLPPFDFFRQNFHCSITNWLPFYWKGFLQTTRYTYVIENLNNLDQVWANFASSVRRAIRKAEKLGVVVEESDNIETFLDLNELTFRRQGLALPYTRDFVRRLDAACATRGARKIYLAYGPDDKPQTGLYCVHDRDTTYYLMQGGDPTSRNSGANCLATWESIKFAATVSKTYDFEGSMIKPIERFFRSFGGRQKPYFQVSKANSLTLKMFLDIRSWWQLWREPS